MPDEHLTPDELRERGFTEAEIAEVARIGAEGVQVPTRQALHLVPPSDPLIAFFWARLDEDERVARDARRNEQFVYGTDRLFATGNDAIVSMAPHRAVDEIAAKKAVLDDYARYCAGVDNPARELICQVTRDVIKRLATVYARHPDYDEAWRP